MSDPTGGGSISVDWILAGSTLLGGAIAGFITWWASAVVNRKQHETSLERDIGRLEGGQQNRRAEDRAARGQAGRNDPSAFSLREDSSHTMRILGRMEEGIENLKDDMKEVRKVQEADARDRSEIRGTVNHINTDIASVKKQVATLRRQITAALKLPKIPASE